MKLKALTEKRAELVEKMNSLVNQADTENRAMSEEEAAAFDAAEKEIKDLVPPSPARSAPASWHRPRPAPPLHPLRLPMRIPRWRSVLSPTTFWAAPWRTAPVRFS